MVLLGLDSFLNELSRLFKRHEKTGSVWVTLKRSSQRPKPRTRTPKKGKKQPVPKAKGDPVLVCLVRATDGERKISTAVSAAEHSKFQASYSLILKAHMDALKKRAKTTKKPEAKKAAPKPQAQ